MMIIIKTAIAGDGVGERTFLCLQKSPKVCVTYRLWQSSPTPGLHVAKLFRTNRRRGEM